MTFSLGVNSQGFTETMTKLIALILLVLLSNATFACQCSYSNVSTESVRSAKNIFVFRLISAELLKSKSKSFVQDQVVGEIELIESIRGKSQFKTIRFSTFWCCGTRLDLGRTYAAFVSGSDNEFYGSSENLLDLGFSNAPMKEFRAKILAVLSGSAELDNALKEYSQRRIDTLPPPPPPPPPCPKVSDGRK